MIEQAAKILVGTAFYVVLLWVTQRSPRAGGIMLTFPALNGIVLLMAEPSRIGQIASSVLFMPLLNASIWAFYLGGFSRLVRRGISATQASWLLLATGATAWALAGAAITSSGWGVPDEAQVPYMMACVLLGAGLTALQGGRAQRQQAGSAERSVGQALLAHRSRIALFVATLLAIALAERGGAPPALLGVLAGLPLIALFSMHGLATDGGVPISGRLLTMEGMARGVWLGPLVAVAFVAGFWRALAWLAGATTGLTYLVCGSVLLMVAWCLSFMAVWALSSIISRATRGPAGA